MSYLPKLEVRNSRFVPVYKPLTEFVSSLNTAVNELTAAGYHKTQLSVTGAYDGGLYVSASRPETDEEYEARTVKYQRDQEEALNSFLAKEAAKSEKEKEAVELLQTLGYSLIEP